ncbi:MAG: hypothetical protein Q8P11_01440 [bacterium]|nr:hypothetical protein [bacterium]
MKHHAFSSKKRQFSNRITSVAVVGMLILTLLTPFDTYAALTFNPNKIISDGEFFDVNSMTSDEIQNFLVEKKSALASKIFPDVDGLVKRAADIIQRAAKEYNLNPKVLIVLLQKEQSLIENPSPRQYSYDWATGYGVCDSCSPTDPRLQKFKGFANQIENAAFQKVYYTTNPERFNFKLGFAADIDGQLVIPETVATAALYNYTPHLHGNENFWKLWTRYFGKFYPDGLVVQEEGAGAVWLLQGGKKRLFASAGALFSRYSKSQIIQIKKGDLDTYETGDVIKFAQYSLLRSPKGAVFLIVDDKRYGITSGKVFREIGFNPEEVVEATDAELADIPVGGLITHTNDNPRGQLYQDKKTGGVFFVKQGIKHPIWAREILTVNFPYTKSTPKSPQELDVLPTGAPVLFDDGTLITSAESSAVYIISNGERRPFASKEVFETLGFQWDSIVNTTDRALHLHAQGDPIDIGIDSSPVTTATLP